MKHNTNHHSNAVYFALLNLADDGTYSITHVEINGPDKFIHIEKHLRLTFCPSCNARMHSKGIYTRRVNHPITQDSMNIYLIVHQRRWICKSCGHTENDSFPFLDKYSHSSNITPYLILDAFRNPFPIDSGYRCPVQYLRLQRTPGLQTLCGSSPASPAGIYIRG